MLNTSFSDPYVFSGNMSDAPSSTRSPELPLTLEGLGHRFMEPQRADGVSWRSQRLADASLFLHPSPDKDPPPLTCPRVCCSIHRRTWKCWWSGTSPRTASEPARGGADSGRSWDKRDQRGAGPPPSSCEDNDGTLSGSNMPAVCSMNWTGDYSKQKKHQDYSELLHWGNLCHWSLMALINTVTNHIFQYIVCFENWDDFISLEGIWILKV